MIPLQAKKKKIRLVVLLQLDITAQMEEIFKNESLYFIFNFSTQSSGLHCGIFMHKYHYTLFFFIVSPSTLPIFLACLFLVCFFHQNSLSLCFIFILYMPYQHIFSSPNFFLVLWLINKHTHTQIYSLHMREYKVFAFMSL